MRTRLALVLLASLVLKLGLLVPTSDLRPVRDSLIYVDHACKLLRAHAYGHSGRAPGYPLALAATFWATERAGVPVACPPEPPAGTARVSALLVARLMQVVLSTLTVWLAWSLGRALYDERAGLAGAALVAFYPNLVGYTHLLWSETLYVALTFGWAILLLRGVHGARPASLFAGGLALGAAALVREIGLLTMVVALTWTWALEPRPARRVLARSLVIVAAAALVVAPWTLRNVRVYGELVPVSTRGGWALLYGASPNVMGEAKRLRLSALDADDLKLNRMARARARGIIAADPRAWLHRVVTVNVPSLWYPGYDGVIAHLVNEDGYGEVPRRLARAGIVTIVGSYLAVGVLAVVGLAFAPRPGARWLILGMVALYAAVHAVVWGLPRHRLPLMALACLPAGWTLTRRPSEWAALVTPRRLAVAGLGIVTFLVLVTSNDMTLLRRRWERAARLSRPAPPAAAPTAAPQRNSRAAGLALSSR
jgi:hypothetical protein